MVNKTDIVVEISMTLEQAVALRDLLGLEDFDDPTDPIYRSLDDALLKAAEQIEGGE